MNLYNYTELKVKDNPILVIVAVRVRRDGANALIAFLTGLSGINSCKNKCVGRKNRAKTLPTWTILKVPNDIIVLLTVHTSHMSKIADAT